jgi:hypothetical protein
VPSDHVFKAGLDVNVAVVGLLAYRKEGEANISAS